jgi:hypothetical protein
VPQSYQNQREKRAENRTARTQKGRLSHTRQKIKTPGQLEKFVLQNDLPPNITHVCQCREVIKTPPHVKKDH